MIKRIFKALIGILSFPIAVSVSVSLYKQLGNVDGVRNFQIYFLLGLGAYAVIYLIFYRPNYPYIFGHEVAHVIFTWLSGGGVKSFRISKNGGEVSTTKSNFLILIGPYFFPTYTVFFVIIYLIISTFHNIKSYNPHFVFLIGFSLAFHIVGTIDFLKVKQTDILKTGYLFSISLIYILNLLVVVLVLSFLFPDISFVAFLKSSTIHSKKIYIYTFKQLFLYL